MNLNHKMFLLKINDLIEYWNLYKKQTVKKSTYYHYNYVISKYILPEFNNMTLSYLEKYNFNEFVEKLSYTLSVKTVRDIVSVLKSILQYGERKFKLDFKLDLISIPKKNNLELEILKESEKKLLISYCLMNLNLKNLGILICLNSGIRVRGNLWTYVERYRFKKWDYKNSSNCSKNI